VKYGVVGDVVVTAQRIESLDHSQHDFEARPCRILISERTRECVDEIVRTEEHGEFLLKGKKERVTLYRVCERVETDPRSERRSQEDSR
jgi:class 3 adenylate cyclase